MPTGLPAQLSPWLISSRQDPRIYPFFHRPRTRRNRRSEEMLLLAGFAILTCCTCRTLGAPSTYDQKQTGDLNVQIHLKDVQLVALLDSYDLSNFGDYDYEYEYFTESPIYNSTTKSPSTSSAGPLPADAPSPTTTEKISPSLVSTALSEEPSNENNTGSNAVGNNTGSPVAGNTSAESLVQKISSEDTASANRTVDGSTNDSSISEDPSRNVTLDIQQNGSGRRTRINDKTGGSFTEKDILKTSGNSASAKVLSPSNKLASEMRHRRKRCNPGNMNANMNKTASSNANATTRKLKGRCRRHNRRGVPRLPFGINLAPRLPNV